MYWSWCLGNNPGCNHKYKWACKEQQFLKWSSFSKAKFCFCIYKLFFDNICEYTFILHIQKLLIKLKDFKLNIKVRNLRLSVCMYVLRLENRSSHKRAHSSACRRGTPGFASVCRSVLWFSPRPSMWSTLRSVGGRVADSVHRKKWNLDSTEVGHFVKHKHIVIIC